MSTSPVSSSAQTETPPLQKRPIDSNFSDIVQTALPVIAMLAGFVFMPLLGAIAFAGAIMIGAFVCYGRPAQKPAEETPPSKPETPESPEAPKSAKKHKTPTPKRVVSKTPPPSASRLDGIQHIHFSPKHEPTEVQNVATFSPIKLTPLPTLRLTPVKQEPPFTEPRLVSTRESSAKIDLDPPVLSEVDEAPPVVKTPALPPRHPRSTRSARLRREASQERLGKKKTPGTGRRPAWNSSNKIIPRDP